MDLGVTDSQDSPEMGAPLAWGCSPEMGATPGILSVVHSFPSSLSYSRECLRRESPMGNHLKNVKISCRMIISAVRE